MRFYFWGLHLQKTGIIMLFNCLGYEGWFPGFKGRNNAHNPCRLSFRLPCWFTRSALHNWAARSIPRVSSSLIESRTPIVWIWCGCVLFYRTWNPVLNERWGFLVLDRYPSNLHLRSSMMKKFASAKTGLNDLLIAKFDRINILIITITNRNEMRAAIRWSQYATRSSVDVFFITLTNTSPGSARYDASNEPNNAVGASTRLLTSSK